MSNVAVRLNFRDSFNKLKTTPDKKSNIILNFSYKGKRFRKSTGFAISYNEFKNRGNLPEIDARLKAIEDTFRFMTIEDIKNYYNTELDLEKTLEDKNLEKSTYRTYKASLKLYNLSGKQDFKKYLISCGYSKSTIKKHLKVIKALSYKKIKSKKVYTYIMSHKEEGVYKIGKSVNPKRRHRTLLHDDPFIELFFVIDKNIEKKLHKKYKNKRLKGEWFNLTKEDIKNIKDEYTKNNKQQKIR